MSVTTTASAIRDSLSSEISQNIKSLRILKDSLELMIDNETWEVMNLTLLLQHKQKKTLKY